MKFLRILQKTNYRLFFRTLSELWDLRLVSSKMVLFESGNIPKWKYPPERSKIKEPIGKLDKTRKRFVASLESRSWTRVILFLVLIFALKSIKMKNCPKYFQFPIAAGPNSAKTTSSILIEDLNSPLKIFCIPNWQNSISECDQWKRKFELICDGLSDFLSVNSKKNFKKAACHFQKKGTRQKRVPSW